MSAPDIDLEAGSDTDPDTGTQAGAAAERARTEVITFGCRLNAYESAVIERNAEAAGLDDAVVVNTCAVTAEAVRQARQTIRRARRDHPGRRIVVTGCAAQVDPGQFAAMAEVDAVIGNQDKLGPAAFEALAAGAAAPVQVTDIMAVREQAGHLIDGFGERARAFVQVQNGCDHRCTFCIIPYGRGNARSTPMGAVVDQIKRLVDRGYGEVVLTGVDLTSYGPDLPGKPSLGRLVQTILAQVPDLARLRISSIDSIEADAALMDAITGDARVMPHLHLSLQAGDDLILKRMKRRHSRADAIAFCQAVRARRPEVAFGADIIAGFPTETEAMFENSLALVDDCDLTWLHVFPFSPRQGTPAARMPQLPKPVRKDRAARLRAAGAARARAFLDRAVGGEVDVLVEKTGRDAAGPFATGHSGQFAPVRLTGSVAPGQIVRARVTARDGDTLLAAPTD
ncbi:tRNA (N(6)-L-threonylcarbamoyladenosine(37)-C(2))-methylthiotransferase MtaB [Rhodothalassium salexigens]|uniref:tRNA (N(6)-L-threonylcarbamoyladenosine(37)-C(2))- methylthiotransferase MtaB n=1 Tax=Rhodothalassium salexigens TaxID=1086 RepID=UPI0019126041|nr:tRNA (N(6)-L-threonylcarbamoyladenosine(37)-C(2))-methylthiotransferase MtaB [Rhodothalassium salexigens]MBK5910254.1 tRNA (N(6)-L-threonylcarbamoyladenosine(37)-C(2))-methylthiotransferase MtaB [Rhodothalassium salexigens]MBK5921385.1 tRNA (N(6)-L-threonylcarbamoyladenosine(37)-C(2))-methylthiotransferase MtaB [Rhodothalassium salexigens]